MIESKQPALRNIERNFDRSVYFVAFPEHIEDIRANGIRSRHMPDKVNSLSSHMESQKALLIWDREGITTRTWLTAFRHFNKLSLIEIDITSIDVPIMFDLNDFINVFWAEGSIGVDAIRRIITGDPESISQEIARASENRVEIQPA